MEETQSVALITGASSGFGHIIATELTRAGYRVFGTSRKPAPTPDTPFVMVPLDVRNDESVQECVQTVLEQAGCIDVLINNAGYGLSGALEETTLAQAQALFATNFFGTVRMVNAVLPHMRQHRQGTIINIGSASGFIAAPFEGFYVASKHAIKGYTEVLRHELRPFHIRVVLVEPGAFRTEFLGAQQRAEHALADYGETRERAIAFWDQIVSHGADPRLVADAVLRILRSKNPGLRHQVGRDARVLAALRCTMPPALFEQITRWTFRLDEQHVPEALTAALNRWMLGWK